MNNNDRQNLPRTEALKNEATRQRWELFHRAIAHAKQSNDSALKQSCDEAGPRTVLFESFVP